MFISEVNQRKSVKTSVGFIMNVNNFKIKINYQNKEWNKLNLSALV